MKIQYKSSRKMQDEGGRCMKTGRAGYISGIIMAAVMLAGCAGSQKLSDKFNEEEVKEAAREVIEILNDQDVDTLVDEKWNSTMKSMAGKEMMTEQILPIIEELGAFEEFDKEAVTGSKDKDTEQEFAVAVVKVKYEKRKAQFTISFDEDMKVGGFYIK